MIFLTFFFLFNTLEIDSNSDKVLLYDKNKIHDEIVRKIYFYNINSNDLENVLNQLNIKVLSYIIDDKKYYANSISELTDKFLIDKKLSDKIYYEKYGFYIDAINVVCETKELIKLEKLTNIY